MPRADRLTAEQMATVHRIIMDEKDRIIEMKKAKAMAANAKGVLKQFLSDFLRDISPYLVIILIIFLLIYFNAGGDLRISRVERGVEKGVSWIGAIINFILSPIRKVQRYLSGFTFYPPEPVTIPRQKMYSGRCDQLRWVQDTTDGTRGFCYSAIRPPDIIWELDKSKMSEFFYLPEIRKQDLNNKMKVRIPYSMTPEDSFYVPRCDLATFVDVPDPKDPSKEMPAPLLEDTGTTCRLRELPSKAFTAKKRNKTSDLSMLHPLPAPMETNTSVPLGNVTDQNSQK